MDDLSRLLELPALARLSASGDELQLITVSHDHADSVTIERRRLGGSIGLDELLLLIGDHGLTQGVPEAPRVELSAPRVPELPAPVEPGSSAPEMSAPIEPAPTPTVRRTTRNPDALSCPTCDRAFKNAHALDVHRGLRHKAPDAAPELAAPDPAVLPPLDEPVPEPVAAPEPEPAQEQPAAAESRLGRLVCPYPSCGKEFKSQLGYATHIEHAHTADLPADAPTVPLREYACSACDTPLAGHLRCTDCQALLGPGHDAGNAHMLINGKALCRTCVSYRGSARELLRTPT